MPACRVLSGHGPAIAYFHCCVKDADVRHKDALLWSLLCLAILFRGGGRYSVDLDKEF
jgi:hypothetical protein